MIGTEREREREIERYTKRQKGKEEREREKYWKRLGWRRKGSEREREKKGKRRKRRKGEEETVDREIILVEAENSTLATLNCFNSLRLNNIYKKDGISSIRIDNIVYGCCWVMTITCKRDLRVKRLLNNRRCRVTTMTCK